MSGKCVFSLLLSVLLAGCEKIVLVDGSGAGTSESDGNVVLRAVVVPSDAPTRGEMMLSEVCGRLNVAVFDGNGKKVKSVSQVVSDADFGSVGLSLSAGSYKVVAVGHSCGGAATITSTEKVTFPNNKVTDTFYFYGDLVVDGNRQEVPIVLHRVVAMVRLIVNDNDRLANVAQLKFYYTGGSSTFSPSAGYGIVNSKQTEYRAWNEDGIYEIYTMPHVADDVLTKLTVTALDGGDNEFGECVLEQVPIRVNHITTYTGDFSGGGGSVTITLTADPEWTTAEHHTF